MGMSVKVNHPVFFEDGSDAEFEVEAYSTHPDEYELDSLICTINTFRIDMNPIQHAVRYGTLPVQVRAIPEPNKATPIFIIDESMAARMIQIVHEATAALQAAIDFTAKSTS